MRYGRRQSLVKKSCTSIVSLRARAKYDFAALPPVLDSRAGVLSGLAHRLLTCAAGVVLSNEFQDIAAPQLDLLDRACFRVRRQCAPGEAQCLLGCRHVAAVERGALDFFATPA